MVLYFSWVLIDFVTETTTCITDDSNFFLENTTPILRRSNLTNEIGRRITKVHNFLMRSVQKGKKQKIRKMID